MALAFGVGLDYFALVFNGSDPLVVTGRDNNATNGQACTIDFDGGDADRRGVRERRRCSVGRLHDRAGGRGRPRPAPPHDAPRRAERRRGAPPRGVWGEARAALNAWLAGGVEQGEIELWARSGSRIEDPRRIPASAVCVLKFDYETGPRAERACRCSTTCACDRLRLRPTAPSGPGPRSAASYGTKDKIPERPTKAAVGASPCSRNGEGCEGRPDPQRAHSGRSRRSTEALGHLAPRFLQVSRKAEICFRHMLRAVFR